MFRRAITALAVGALTMSVVATSATSVLGADTRHLYVGSGPVGDATNGILTLTPVSAGGVTASDVIVKNVDNQTLTHVVLTFMAPTGLTLSGVFGTNASLCLPGATAPLVCDFGNLAKNQTRTFTVLYTAGAAGAATVSAKVTFNETRPNPGGNTHIDPIGGAVTVDAATCDHVATFLAPRSGPANIGTDTGCALSLSNPQTTSVEIPGSVVSAVTVGESSTVLCAPGLTCFGQVSTADVALDGTYLVRWTIQWQVVSNYNTQKFGILHFPDGATVPDLTLTAKKNMCKNAAQVGCIESVNLVGTTLTAVVRTAGNGNMRGF